MNPKQLNRRGRPTAHKRYDVLKKQPRAAGIQKRSHKKAEKRHSVSVKKNRKKT